MSERLPTEPEIEAHLMEVAARVDAAVGSSAGWGCLLWVVGTVGGTFVLGPLITYIGAVLVSGVLSIVAFGMVAAGLDNRAIGKARREFDRRYPKGSEVRPLAERVLRELHSDGKGLPQFRDAVFATPVRRVLSAPPIERQLADATRETANARPAPPPAPPPPATPEPARVVATAASHMPLEPFDDPGDGKGGGSDGGQ